MATRTPATRGGTRPSTAPTGRRGRPAAPPVPLGSLTQRELVVAAECDACGSGRVTRLRMTLTDGTPVVFTSCHRCERRSWQHQDADLSVEDVLDRTRKPV
jgi:hypothetical protein